MSVQLLCYHSLLEFLAAFSSVYCSHFSQLCKLCIQATTPVAAWLTNHSWIPGVTHYQLKTPGRQKWSLWQHSYLNAVSKQVCKNYHSLKTFAGIAAHLFEQPPVRFHPWNLHFCVWVSAKRERKEWLKLLYSTGTLIRRRCGVSLAPMKRSCPYCWMLPSFVQMSFIHCHFSSWSFSTFPDF